MAPMNFMIYVFFKRNNNDISFKNSGVYFDVRSISVFLEILVIASFYDVLRKYIRQVYILFFYVLLGSDYFSGLGISYT